MSKTSNRDPSMPIHFPLSKLATETLSIISEYLNLTELYALLTSGDRNLIIRLKSSSGVHRVCFTVPKGYGMQERISYVASQLSNVKKFSVRGRDDNLSDFGHAKLTTLSSVDYRRIAGIINYSTNLPYEYGLNNGIVEKMEIYPSFGFKVPSTLTYLSLTRYEISEMDLDELTKAVPSLTVFKIPNSAAVFRCHHQPILPNLKVFDVSPRARFSTDSVSFSDELAEAFFAFLPSGLESFAHPLVFHIGYKFKWWTNLKHLSITISGQGNLQKLILPPQVISVELIGTIEYRQLPEMNFPSSLLRLTILDLDVPGSFVEALPTSIIHREFQ